MPRTAMLLSIYLCFAMLLVPMQTSTSQAQVTSLSILRNGGFESGLLNWTSIESGDGSTTVSGLVSHSGAHSLLTDLEPISMITHTQVQGAQQSATVHKLRGLSFEAWFMTPLCSFPPGVTGRVLIQVEELAIHYQVDANCGFWERLSRNVTADFQAEFGSDGRRLFELESSISILTALELVRSAPDATALSEYLSIYWDDVNATASVESTEGMNTTVASTTTSEAVATIASAPTIPATTSQPETTLISQLPSSLNWMGLFMVAALVVLSVAAVVTVAVVRSPKGIEQVSSVRMRCPRCGRWLRLQDDTRYCTRCGASLTGSALCLPAPETAASTQAP